MSGAPKIIRPFTPFESDARQRHLWVNAISKAFPYADSSDAGRIAIGEQLETLRKLRNRVAHHDSLLAVNVRHRLNDILSLVAKIDPALPPLVTARTPLRRLAREDPRLQW